MSSDLIEIIEKALPDMSKGQKRIAAYITEHCEKAAYMTASRLGEEAGVSESTVVRFAIELGFDGYPELHRAMQESLRKRLTAVQRIEVANDRFAKNGVLETVLTQDAERIRSTLESIDHQAFDNAVEAILNAGTIYIMGMRSSFSLAEFVDYNLSLVFPNVHLVRNASGSEMFEHLMRVREGDAVIAISFPRYSKRIIKAADFAQGRGANVVAITDGPTSPIAKCAAAALYAKSDMASYADSLVAPLSIINALLAAIGLKKQEQVTRALRDLEAVWDQYDVYDKKKVTDK
ncbi:MAG: MurR/RpiR family transcriptional regulator [Ruminococcaceae bacterium]|nr:MurR/RpiR family transcriptional regulator [Oscillospiraceae bacterium]